MENLKTSLKVKVGIFTILGFLLIGSVTVFVNDKPFWWRGCELVYLNINDATGLKSKSPVRSLGLQIGYLKSVELYETYVRLGICVTAPVEVIAATRASIRDEGFLGDKFVELKPVRYLGRDQKVSKKQVPAKASATPVLDETEAATPTPEMTFNGLLNFMMPMAFAEEPAGAAPPEGGAGEKEIPLEDNQKNITNLVNKMDTLVSQLNSLTSGLKDALNPDDLKRVMSQLNKTLENAATTLSPQGQLTTTAQRTLSKMEDAIEQLRQTLTRINQGQGSLGALINDPTYAEEIKEAIRGVNRLLGRVGRVRFVVDIHAESVQAYQGSRGSFMMAVWPERDRYYRLGVSLDPRGRQKKTKTVTTVGGTTTVTETTQTEDTGILLTVLFGKVLWERADFNLGVMYGDATVSAGIYLGPYSYEDKFKVTAQFYSNSRLSGVFRADTRMDLTAHPFYGHPYLKNFYVSGGVDSIRKFAGKLPWYVGGGISFDDEDIKLLFAFR